MIKTRFYFLISLLMPFMSLAQVHALDWPTIQSSLASNFGSNEDGRALVGIGFRGDEPIRASDFGEIIFNSDTQQLIHRFPQPLGAWTALEHEDGIISLYSRYAPKTEKRSEKRLEKASIVANSGISGWSNSSGFFYAVIDRLAGRWVNPALISPLRPDNTQPIIEQVLLIGRDNAILNPKTARTIRQGYYRVVIEAKDNEEKNLPLSLGPQEISCFVNGIEEQTLRMDYFSAKDGEFLIPGNPVRSVNEVFLPKKQYQLGEIRLNRGRSSLQIHVRDIVGNERQVIYILRVE